MRIRERLLVVSRPWSMDRKGSARQGSSEVNGTEHFCPNRAPFTRRRGEEMDDDGERCGRTGLRTCRPEGSPWAEPRRPVAESAPRALVAAAGPWMPLLHLEPQLEALLLHRCPLIFRDRHRCRRRAEFGSPPRRRPFVPPPHADTFARGRSNVRTRVEHLPRPLRPRPRPYRVYPRRFETG